MLVKSVIAAPSHSNPERVQGGSVQGTQHSRITQICGPLAGSSDPRTRSRTCVEIIQHSVMGLEKVNSSD